MAAYALLCAACAKEGPPPAVVDEPASELKWARAALERNPDLKVVAIDQERNAIKVAVKATGEMLSVTPGELAALPIADLVALNNAAHAARESTPVAEVVEATPVPETPRMEPAAERTAAEYKVEQQDGRLRITGPGVNVESTGVAATNSLPATSRYDEPIICEGPRLLHLDRRRMNVDGDAIIARGGCELHLTNSEIAATGTAIVVLDATVHVGNSTIQGGSASYDAGPSAKLYLSNTRFAGIARRDTQAKINDQGGNVWR